MHSAREALLGQQSKGRTVAPHLGDRPKLKPGQPFAPANQFRYYQAPHGLIGDPKLSSGSKILWMLLAQHAGQESTAWPSERTLGALMGRSIRQVQRYAAELRGAGLIKNRVENSGKYLWTLVYQPRLDGAYQGIPSRGVRLPVRQAHDVSGGHPTT